MLECRAEKCLLDALTYLLDLDAFLGDWDASPQLSIGRRIRTEDARQASPNNGTLRQQRPKGLQGYSLGRE